MYTGMHVIMMLQTTGIINLLDNYADGSEIAMNASEILHRFSLISISNTTVTSFHPF